MTLKIYEELEQGTPEWLAARCGIVTASIVNDLVTAKTLKVAANDTSRGRTALLVGERLTGRSEPVYPSRDMDRGTYEEPFAREAYSEHYAAATEVGFMVRDDWGFKIGYSPDGLVGDDGLIEIKSRAPKKHIATILTDEVPAENMAQLQTGLLVSGRKWIDYVSFCGGMPLYVKRVLPDPAWQAVIVQAVTILEASAGQMIADYTKAVQDMPTTERPPAYDEMDMVF